MAKFEVVIEEIHTYNITVDAETEQEAEELAFQSEKYLQSDIDDTDSKVVEVSEIEEEE